MENLVPPSTDLGHKLTNISKFKIWYLLFLQKQSPGHRNLLTCVSDMLQTAVSPVSATGECLNVDGVEEWRIWSSREGRREGRREGGGEVWAVVQLAVTGPDEAQVVQLGASASPEPGRRLPAAPGKSLSSNKWSVNTVCHMQMSPIWYLRTCSAAGNVTSSRGWAGCEECQRATGVSHDLGSDEGRQSTAVC